MLQLLTQYLLQYRTVCVPHVGTLQIVQQPAQLDVAGKRILPPTFSATLSTDNNVSEHQLQWLDAALGNGKEAVAKELRFLGNKIQEQMAGAGYEWQGLGRITRSTQELPLAVAGLEPVYAEKIRRADVQHAVLVGDKEMMSGEMPERRTFEPFTSKRSVEVLVGWILLILAILAIAYFFYIGKFNVNAAGSKIGL